MRERPELWERAPRSLNASCAPAQGARSRIYNPCPSRSALVARPARAGAAAAGHRSCFLLLLSENPISSPTPRDPVEGVKQPQQGGEGVRREEAPLPAFKS